MRKIKSAKMTLFMLSVVLIFGGCASSKAQNKNMTDPICKITDLQKLLAEKPLKLISENNPIATQQFTADPAVLVYNDTVYIYGTNDSQQLEFSKGKADNSYDHINSLNCFCSKDLVNWTDLGIIPVAGKTGGAGDAKWATNSWAPAICCKNIDGKDKFFLYFADSANGIGVLTSDSPTGPFTDPLGHALISRSHKNCEKVYWLFDPAVIVDDDGTGYLFFGGGVADDPAHPKSARCAKLGDDMISLACDPIEIDAPWLFEDSGINKIGNTWYYTYCSNWTDRNGAKGPDVLPIAVIAYMTSASPLGPYEFKGYTLENPGTYYGPWGNNHHWIFQFKNKWYIAYHAQTLEKQVQLEKGGYRELFINSFEINKDGSLPIQKAGKTGIDQACAFEMKGSYKASTCHSYKNVAFTNTRTITPVKDGAWLCLKGVNLAALPAEISFTSCNKNSKGKVTVMAGHWVSGEKLGEVSIEGEGNFATALKAPSDSTLTNIYFVFSGDLELSSWERK